MKMLQEWVSFLALLPCKNRVSVLKTLSWKQRPGSHSRCQAGQRLGLEPSSLQNSQKYMLLTSHPGQICYSSPKQAKTSRANAAEMSALRLCVVTLYTGILLT